MAEIDGLLEHYLALKASMDIIQEKADLVKTKLKIYMEEKEIEKFEDKSGNCAVYKNVTRKSLDRKKVEERLAPEKLKECFKETSFSSITIISKENAEKRKVYVEKK